MGRKEEKMKTKLITVVFVMLLMTAGLWASNPGATDSQYIIFSMRLYEAISKEKASTFKPGVSTASYVETAFVGNVFSEEDLQKEKQKLKRVFNVSDVKLKIQTHWIYIYGYPPKIYRIFQKNGSTISMLLTKKEKKDTFRIEVFDGRKSKNKKGLLDTEIILPEKHTVIYGYKDLKNKAYFLSFHREADVKNVGTKEAAEQILVSTQYKSELEHYVRPVYPKDAIEKGIEGRVTLKADIDHKGNVKNIKEINGPLHLQQAVIDAVRQWKYQPPKPDIKADPLPVPFTVFVSFDLPEEKESNSIKMQPGEIIGTITTEDGTVIQGVHIKITNAQGKMERTTQTDQNGFYGFMSLQPDQYQLTFTHKDYFTLIRKNVHEGGKTLKVNIKMKKRKNN